MMEGLFTRYGLLCALALLTALAFSGIWMRKQGVGYGVWIRLCVLAVPLCWVCSRTLYCLGTIPYYFMEMEMPALMLRFWEGGYSMFGALGGLMLAGALTARWQHVSAGALLDSLALGAPLGIIIARLAQAGTYIGVGDPIENDWLLPIAVTESLRHPVYLYEAVAAGILLIGLLISLAARRGKMPRGDVALSFLTYYGCMQVILESLCDDGHMVVHHFVHLNQIFAIVLPVIAVAVWSVRALRRGMKKGPAAAVWVVTAAMIGVGIVEEFAADRGDSKLAAYAFMAAAMAVVCLGALFLRRRAKA